MAYQIYNYKTCNVPKSVSAFSVPSPVPLLVKLAAAVRPPGLSAQAFAMEVTRCSSSALRHPHQLISGWLQRAITAPVLECLQKREVAYILHPYTACTFYKTACRLQLSFSACSSGVKCYRRHHLHEACMCTPFASTIQKYWQYTSQSET